MNQRELLFILGTRPEAVKCSPVILECRRDDRFAVRVLTTSQHRELQDQVLDEFGIDADHDLDLMRETPDLARLIGDAWVGLCRYFDRNAPDMVLVQGDTSTAFIAALAAQYHRVPVAHIEAGLRTHDKTMPFPEEINRRLIGPISDLHFAPTIQAKENLLRENIASNQIVVVGNPGIDALLHIVDRQKDVGLQDRFPQLDPQKPMLLATCHRRENWGEPIRNICLALREIAKDNPNYQILFLTHPNPEASRAAKSILAGVPQIIPHESVIYSDMALLLNAARLILTDSGGLQEEAPVLGKPVVVLREKTERQEGIESQSAILAGANPERILDAVQSLLHDESFYRKHAQKRSPYGDGRASERIRRALAHHFGLGEPPQEFHAAST
ncbi:MAG: UDP-N-acetylglucosamine 2-epimerase (non-hydrolyzing) [Candidatus Omnitrophica bacterium]|nr:UDP-N-acetylglucosamine 2-epimerase (non-hydrolyzing) [Candidatus Omnitrophota bacterium]